MAGEMNALDEREALDRFRRMVLADPALFAMLRAASGMEEFVALTVRLGQAHSCAFTPALVRAVWLEEQRRWRERWV